MPTSFCHSMRNHGYTTALPLSTSSVSTLDHVLLFLSYLNRQHPNIFFSSELEKDGRLPFLDNEITRSNGRFSTLVYRKPTFTGLFTNFHSFVPLAYKGSLVCCLLHRVFHLCSSYENFHARLEVVRKRKLFNLNGFPIHMFDQLVRHFLNKLFEPKPPSQFRTQITRLRSAAYSHLNIRFVFRSPTRISSFFLFKDKVPNSLSIYLYLYSLKFFIFTLFMALLKVICWAIIFITRIRFPSGKSLATILKTNV